MSSRFENGYVALALTCVSLIFVVGYICITFAFSEGYKSADKEHEAYYASRHAREKAYAECLKRSLTIPEATSCVNNSSDTTREDERAEQDLNAQREMAQWAKGMLWATLIIGMSTVLVTAVGVLYVRNTLNETRRAVKAADDAVGVTREIGQAQTRAYLSITGAKFWVDTTMRPTFELTFKNSGNSPSLDGAENIAILAHDRGQGALDADGTVNVIFERKDRFVSDLGAGESRPQETGLSYSIEGNPEWMMSAVARVRYKTVFSDEVLEVYFLIMFFPEFDWPTDAKPVECTVTTLVRSDINQAS